MVPIRSVPFRLSLPLFFLPLTLAGLTRNVSAVYYVSSGAGSSYASACASAHSAYNSSYYAWISNHANITTSSVYGGGTVTSDITYYANATTLCDGHARVTASPAVPLATKTTTSTGPITTTNVFTQTAWYGGPAGPSPVCIIAPSDCDPLWQSYSTSLQSYEAHRITAAPQTPICLNRTAASVASSFDASLYGCGDCTIYGEGVELLYFPVATTVSRDMCASAPLATLTHYNEGDVLEAYAGTTTGSAKPVSAGTEIAILNGHTFTSGTAYISISKVYAVDRCSKAVGTVIHDAILAMSSSAVLSLRYSQNHFQALWATDQQTGYPVSYADFNKPVPYSAWIGQSRCEGPWDQDRCGVIYENDYRPQLAIPPGIKKLDPRWSTCQMYFRGLYDPPLALQAVSTIALPTVPNEGSKGQPTGQTTPIQYTPALPADQPTTPNAPSTPTSKTPVPPTGIPDQVSSGYLDKSPQVSASSPASRATQSTSQEMAEGSSQRHGHEAALGRQKQTVVIYRDSSSPAATNVGAFPPTSTTNAGAFPTTGTTTTTTVSLFLKTIVTVVQSAPSAPVYLTGPGIQTTITVGRDAVTFTANDNVKQKVVMSAVASGVVVDRESGAADSVSTEGDNNSNNQNHNGDDRPTAGTGFDVPSTVQPTTPSKVPSGEQFPAFSTSAGSVNNSPSPPTVQKASSGARRLCISFGVLLQIIALHMII